MNLCSTNADTNSYLRLPKKDQKSPTKYLIGIDLGTSGTKTVLFTEAGAVVASALAEYPLYQPQNGWAEQDPAHWWDACVTTVKTVLSGVDAKQVAGIGLSGQMHGLVLLDGNGKVLRNSILWCDGRTAAECAEITETIGTKRLVEITANPALTGFTAGKILWVRKNEPELYAKVRHILLPKDYLRYKLTGVIASEVSDASGMNLLDIRTRQWSDEILSKLNIDREFLPSMHESFEITGGVSAEAAALTGLQEGTPVVGGAGDNAAAAVGTGIVENGKAFVTIGTSGVIFAHSDSVAIDHFGRVHTFCAAVPGAWTVMSCTLSAGGSLQWFRNNFCAAEMQAASDMGKDSYELLNIEAERVPIGSNRLLFLPYLMGERSPILNPNARGVFFGLSGMHRRPDMLRAVMEGVVFSQRSCLDILREMNVPFKEMIATGGGSRSVLWRQMLADVLNCPVVTIDNAEGPALGVAILAGVGVGLYANIPEACATLIKKREPQQPSRESSVQYEPYYKLYTELYGQLTEPFKTLAGL